MGSKGSQTVTQQGNQTQTYTPNPAIGGAGGQALNMAQTAVGAPFQQPVAPVAPFSPFQSIGFGETLGLQGMAQPYFNTAGNYLAGSAAPITGADVANYYNPMADNVTRQMQNIFGQQNVQNTGNLVQSAGGVGADRVAVGQANMANQQALAAGQTYAGLYQQALAAAEQNKQMQAGAGFAFGQMGPAAQAAQQNAVNQLLGVGAQQQGLNQQELNAIYQNQLARIAYPFQTGQYLAGITAGLAPGMGGTTQGQYYGQTTGPSPSALAQILGVGAAGLGMAGQSGLLGGGLGSMGTALMGGAPFSAASQYLPGGSAYGATPMAVNGGMYPMFPSRGGRINARADGGGVGDDYGKLADREYYDAQGNILAGAGRGNPMAITLEKDLGGVYNYEDGGHVIPVGEVVPFNQFHNTRTLQEAIDRIDNRKQPGAQGFAGAPPEAVESAHDTGVLKIHPLHGFDEGGNVDIPVGQASPMSLTIDPTNRGLNYPGAGKVSGSPVPQMQLPQGQPGKSGPYGQFIYGLGSHSPSMPQGGGQSPMGGGLGGLGQLGQLGGSLGKMFGGLGGGSAAADAGAAGAGVDFAGLTGDLGASIDEIGALLPLAAAAATGGGMGGEPPGGSLADNARRWQGFESRFPKDAPPVDWNMMPYAHGNYGKTAAGGAVDPMHPGAGYGDDDVDIGTAPVSPSFELGPTGDPIPNLGPQEPTSPSQLWHKIEGLMAPSGPQFGPPKPPPTDEALGYGPGRSAMQGNPLESYDESLAYGPGVGRRVGPAETLSDTTGRAPATIQRTGPGEAARGPYEAPPLDPLGHGTGAPGAQGVMGQPGAQLDMAPFRRATIAQESSGNAGNVTTTRRTDGTVQRALGLYGIMDFNLPQWSKEAVGRVVSPQEFLANPDLQTAIYDHKMGQYIQQYGVEGAGRAWLGGEGSLNAPMRADPLGTRVGDYGRHFASLVQSPDVRNQTLVGMRTSNLPQSPNIDDRTQGPMGSQPARNVPFPNATDPNSVARRWTMSPWAALTNAGVQMAQSRGPIGSVIAGGIGAASRTFANQQQELNSEQAINDRAEHLAMLAQQHLDAYTKEPLSHRLARESTEKYHDALLQYKGSALWSSIHDKMRNEAAWVGRLGSTDPADVQAVDEEIASRILKGEGSGQSQGEPGSTQANPIPDPGPGKYEKGKWYRTSQGIQQGQ